jgi:hypothetical protein
MAPNQSLLFYLQTTSLDGKQQMIASTAQVARFKELQKQKMIIDVIAESTIFKTPLEDGAVEPQFPLLRVTQGDLEAWYEIIDKLPVIQIRRVYCLADYDFVQSVLHKAQLKWPESKESESNSSGYWESNPAIAIRHCFSGPTPVTGILYQMRGRGDVGIVLPQLEEKLTFLRQQFVDAYLTWIPQYLEDESNQSLSM